MKVSLRSLPRLCVWAAGLAAVTVAISPLAAHAQLKMSGEPVKATKSQAALSLRQPNLSELEAAVVRMGPANASEINAIQERNATLQQKSMQVGIVRKLKDEFLVSPTLRWVAHNDGGGISRLVVSSQDAKALRVGLDVTGLPDGAELRFANAAGEVTYAATAADIREARRESTTYWTPLTVGAEQIIEVYVPPGQSAAGVRINVDSASHLFASPNDGFKTAKALGDSGTCNVDVRCEPQTTAFVNAKNAVAWMQFQATCGTGGALASCICTGTLLNDGDTSTQIPYFYSANHCIGTQTEASTLNTIWSYERSACGGGSASTSNIVAGGADLLYKETNRDALLLKLRGSPPSGAFFAGWDANTITEGTTFTAIHHPRGDAKKVSKGRFVGFTPLSEFANQQFTTAAWTSGTTEGGSSGSAIFTFADNEYFVRGSLYGGFAACSNAGNVDNTNNRDWYSRFDQVFPNIRKYLAVDYSGSWSDPTEDGTGISIIQGESSGTLGIIWYQYTAAPERKPIWFFFSGNWTGINTFNGSWIQLSRTGYTEPYNPAIASSQVVGSATFTFTSPTTLTMSYTMSGGLRGTKNLVRLTF
ncbi:MAG: trypsin-like peptidase domain-containing protein [Betaproteobacteria bacterium]|nr:trypsin-like peptidase domain-containing protein [Betaproteobacteria bacterium]